MHGNSTYDPQVADSILSRIEAGEALVKICDSEGFPNRATVLRWCAQHEDFRANYARARLIQAELMADDLLCIADEASPEEYNVARLRVDTRKWLLSKVLPKVYGDATMLKHADADGNVLKIELSRVEPRPARVIDVTPEPAATQLAPAGTEDPGPG